MLSDILHPRAFILINILIKKHCIRMNKMLCGRIKKCGRMND